MNVTNLFSDIDFLCGSTSASYPTGDKLRNINIHYNDVARVIWESADGWQYDDSNATTLPISKTTMVHAQADYTLPSTAQRVHRIEVKDSQGNWLKLSQMDASDIGQAMPELYSDPNVPLYYDLIGRSLVLYPSPHSAYCTMASGLAVYVDRDVTQLSATSATPGFATQFHRILSYGTAMDLVKDNVQRQFLAEQKDRLLKGLTRFYGKRMVERTTRLTPHSKKSWRQFV